MIHLSVKHCVTTAQISCDMNPENPVTPTAQHILALQAGRLWIRHASRAREECPIVKPSGIAPRCQLAGVGVVCFCYFFPMVLDVIFWCFLMYSKLLLQVFWCVRRTSVAGAGKRNHRLSPLLGQRCLDVLQRSIWFVFNRVFRYFLFKL